METIDTTLKTSNYSLGEDFSDDFELYAKQNIVDLITGRFQKIGNDLNGKHFYSLKIIQTPTRINYHQFSFDRLQEISRKLTNGLTTLGFIPNRKFWNRYFIGGVRTISIKQEEQNEYPSFTLNYLIYSDVDNLDVRIKPSLMTRIKMIDPSLQSSFTYLGSYSENIILENIEYKTDVVFSSPNIHKLGEKNVGDVFRNQFQRPRFFGQLFKSNTL